MQKYLDGVERLNIGLSDTQLEMLVGYARLLLKWNKTYNLIAPTTEKDIFTRHILDSLQLLPHLPSGDSILLDVGSGSGLPALIIAICRPDIQVHTCERVGKKCQFMNQVRRELNLKNVTIHQKDCRELDLKADIITSRAFAELSDILDWSSHCLKESGFYLLLKGIKAKSEIDTAKLNYRLRASLNSSITDKEGSVLTIRDLSRLSD